jgi:F-type H+-transporting ATPase subunit b
MGHLGFLAPAFRVLAAGGEHASAQPSLADPLLSHWLWTWIVFALVFLVLWKFAFRPIRDQLEAREKRIKDTVDKADQVKSEAAALLDKHRELMDRAKADAQEIINQGRIAAEAAKKEAAAAAQEEAQVLRDRAKREIELETRKAVEEIRSQTVDLTLLAASRVLERSVTDSDHRRMTQDVLAEIDRAVARRKKD